MSKETLIGHLRNIPDYPMEGVQFKDVTSWFMDPDDYKEIVDSMYEMYKGKGITKICGIESRGFVVAAALAYRLGAAFIPIRKPGKLPFEKVSIEYKKEYGRDRVEIHKDAINEDDVILIHDDLLATGGTMLAAYQLVKMFNPKKIMMNFIIELTNLDGKSKFPSDCIIESLISIDEFDNVE